MEVKYNLVGIEENESTVLTTAIPMRANIHQTAVENICSAQEKQCRQKWVKKCF